VVQISPLLYAPENDLDMKYQMIFKILSSADLAVRNLKDANCSAEAR